MARHASLSGVVDLHLSCLLGDIAVAAAKAKVGHQVCHSFLVNVPLLNWYKTQYLPYSYDTSLIYIFQGGIKVITYNCLASLIKLLVRISNRTSGARL